MKKFLNYRFRVYLAIALISLFTGCTWQQESGKANNKIVDVIDLKNAQNYISLDLKEIIKDVQGIPLQSGSGILIKEIDKIIEYKNKFFVLDRFQSQGVFAFKNNGEFIYKINTIGKEPGSIMYPLDIIIDSAQENLIVLDNDNRRINFYDANTGKFKHSVRNKMPATRFKQIKSGGWWFTGGNSPSNITLVDDNFNRLMNFMNKEPGRPKTVYQSFLSVGDTLDMFIRNYCDTIFRIDGDKIFAYRKIKFNQEDSTTFIDTTYNYADIIKAFPNRKFLYKYYFENNAHIFFTYIEKSNLTGVVYNKKNKKIISFPVENCNTNALFLNAFPVIVSVGNDGNFIAVGDGDNFANISKDPSSGSLFGLFNNKNSLLLNIKKDSPVFRHNPVLIKFNFQ